MKISCVRYHEVVVSFFRDIHASDNVTSAQQPPNNHQLSNDYLDNSSYHLFRGYKHETIPTDCPIPSVSSGRSGWFS
jgi:hypothetical protein